MLMECKNCCTCKKDHSLNLSTCIYENAKYLKSIVDDSKIVFDGIIYIMDIVPTNVTSTASINSDVKKVRLKTDCYILHPVLLVIILLFILTIIYYHYAKHRSKQKGIDALTI